MKLEARGHRPVFRVERAAPALRTAPATTSAGLLRQLADVISDVPLFLVTPLLRPWHRTWGATPQEVAAAMPGDDLLPRAQYRCTRAITIAATPAEVWPWLVQLGQDRGWAVQLPVAGEPGRLPDAQHRPDHPRAPGPPGG